METTEGFNLSVGYVLQLNPFINTCNFMHPIPTLIEEAELVWTLKIKPSYKIELLIVMGNELENGICLTFVLNSASSVKAKNKPHLKGANLEYPIIVLNPFGYSELTV